MSRWKIIPGVNVIISWQNVFVSIPFFDIIVESLNYCYTNKGLHLHAYVIMPNHAHYIVSADPPELLSSIMRDFNRFTSQKITALLEENNKIEMLDIFNKAVSNEERGNHYKVWQEGFHPIAIDSEDFFRQKLDYLHDNPVRKGFVEKPEHWQYSSARNYIMDDDSVIKVECLE